MLDDWQELAEAACWLAVATACDAAIAMADVTLGVLRGVGDAIHALGDAYAR